MIKYLNKLPDEYNNTNIHSIGKKPTHVDYSAWTEEIETNPKAPKFKAGIRVKITMHKNIFSNYEKKCC